jgi:Ca-activated chloride channel family protein
MNENELKRAFETPAPDESAKQKAIRLALEEFELTKSQTAVREETQQQERASRFLQIFRRLGQGFFKGSRPTGENNPQRIEKMNLLQNKLLLSGLATSTLVVAGLVIFNQNAINQFQQLPDGVQIAQKPEQDVMLVAASSDAEVSRDLPAAPVPELAASTIHQPQPMAARAKQFSPQYSATLQKPAELAPQPQREYRDRFSEFDENPVKSVTEEPVSTFSVDVDTASYSFVRRSLNQGYLPNKDAVRVEELINYFDYDYPVPADRSQPFKPSLVVTESPWKPGNKLVHIGIKGYQLPAGEVPRSNLVFLMDVSGSMFSADRLPLAQQAMELLLDRLGPEDTVAIVVYAGSAGAVLEPTKVAEKEKIRAAIRNLRAGGSTAGAEGILLAYELAERHFDPKAVNRIFLATDGDFNVGPTGDRDLLSLVERKRQSGIYLSVLGFGMGNYQDGMMQTLAQNGNGVAAYIDTLGEAQKLLVHEAQSALFPIASDVKIQVEFNPAQVAEYRLIGYETRALKREDFNNDRVDAGDIGAGHSVTAIYEITPVGGKTLLEASRYQPKQQPRMDDRSGEYGFLRIRYKLPGEETSRLIEAPIPAVETEVTHPLKREADFATAVAAFGQLLKGSSHMGNYTYDQVIQLAQTAKGEGEFGYRSEFIQLVRKAPLARPL